ncbi:MAG: flagellar biosynthetic protein FliO [Planctomycetales bacterium]
MNGWRTILGTVCLLAMSPLLRGADTVPPKLKNSGPRTPVNATPSKTSKVIQAAGTESEPEEGMPALPPRKSEPSTGFRTGAATKTSGSSNGWSTTLLSLSVVIALILSCAYAFRKQIPLASKILPADVIEVLGKRYLDPRNSIHLIRCGSKILIVAHSPQHGMQPLSEITDPVQVDELAGRCFQGRSNSASQRFSQVLGSQLGGAGEEESPETNHTEGGSARSGKARTRGAVNV